MRYLLTAVFAILFFTGQANATPGIDRNSFGPLDEYVSKLGPLKDYTLQAIVDTITAKCHDDDICRARAIYLWVGQNITYDSKGYRHPKQYNGSASGALNERKATCEGYTNIFQAMCDLAHVKCITINGYAKSDPKTIGKITKRNRHSWNAVQIKGTWYVVDPTWGAGTTEGKRRDFKKDFTDAWWFTDRHQFALCHYPDDKKYQFLDSPINKTVFNSAPIVGAAAIVYGVQLPAGTRGTVKGKQDTTSKLVYEVSRPEFIKSVSASDVYNKPIPIPFSINGNQLTVNVPFKGKGNYPFTLFINGDPAYSYNAHVSKRKEVVKKKVAKKPKQKKKPEPRKADKPS